jgi:hypothetical protein
MCQNGILRSNLERRYQDGRPGHLNPMNRYARPKSDGGSMAARHGGAMGFSVGLPVRATTHGSMGSLRENKATAHGKLTQWSSLARVAPRRLAAAVGFILHSGSACGGSK